jgi:hypothetical protein
LHVQIGTKEFMNILVSLLNMKTMPKEVSSNLNWSVIMPL